MITKTSDFVSLNIYKLRAKFKDTFFSECIMPMRIQTKQKILNGSAIYIYLICYKMNLIFVIIANIILCDLESDVIY